MASPTQKQYAMLQENSYIYICKASSHVLIQFAPLFHKSPLLLPVATEMSLVHKSPLHVATKHLKKDRVI